MLRNLMLRMGIVSSWIFVWILINGIESRILYGQINTTPYTTLDRTTRQSLDQLRHLVTIGDTQKAIEHLQRVINSSGYIRPLAEFYYKLTPSETNGHTLAEYYATIISHWPDSAWAQKAATEMIPLLLMSSGTIGAQYESILWEKQNQLLSITDDAASIGEDPLLLRSDTLIHMVYLAHYRKEVGRVLAIVNIDWKTTPSTQSIMELANAYAQLRSEQPVQTEISLDHWLQTYSDSQLRPFALVALFHATNNTAKKMEIVKRIREEFPDTLEAAMLRKYAEGMFE